MDPIVWALVIWLIGAAVTAALVEWFDPAYRRSRIEILPLWPIVLFLLVRTLDEGFGTLEEYRERKKEARNTR